MNVVKAQQGQLLGNLQPDFLRRLQNAQGVGIGGGKNGRVIAFLGKQLLGQLIAVLDRGGREGIVAEPGGQSELPAGLLISLSPELMEKYREKFRRAEILLGVKGNTPITFKTEAKPKAKLEKPKPRHEAQR